MKALEIQGVTKKIHQKTILDDVSFSLESGEVVGLVGPNGAGKSSLMKIIAGYNFPTAGSVEICGSDVVRERAKAMENAAFLVEGAGLYGNLSGKRHLEMVERWRGKRTEDEWEDAHCFTNFELKGKVRTYSVGMKERLALGICWLCGPRLLVLDEPVNGLDPEGIFLLRKKIEEASERGTAVLVSSHLLSELQKTARRFVFINRGKIIGEGRADSGDQLETLYASLFGNGA